jgi:hypothetical protein
VRFFFQRFDEQVFKAYAKLFQGGTSGSKMKSYTWTYLFYKVGSVVNVQQLFEVSTLYDVPLLSALDYLLYIIDDGN